MNNFNTCNCSPSIPTRYTNYLDKGKYLSEFSTKLDKLVARYNLGIDELIELLNTKIDNKVIERGSIPWDLAPSENGYKKILSSATIYNALLNYALLSDVDNQIQNVWEQILYKIQETYNKIENELNQLNSFFTKQMDELECKFNRFTTSINQNFSKFLSEINEQVSELYQNFNIVKLELLNKIINIEDYVLTNVKNLNDLYRELRNFVSNLYETLYNSLLCNILNDIYTNKINPLDDRMKHLEYLVQTFLLSNGGTAIDNKFGDSEYMTVNQKVLADSFDKVWLTLEKITGLTLLGIHMTVTPDYFISEDGCNVHVTAETVNTNGIFEHIAFYMIKDNKWELLKEEDNIDFLEFDTYITDSTIIKCEATIMGRKYEKQHAITHYNSFWLGSGTNYEDIMDELHTIPIENGIRVSRDVSMEDGDHIIIVMGKQLRNGFIRADLNGLEIQFTETTVNIDNIEYCVLISKNEYQAGNYNIDING